MKTEYTHRATICAPLSLLYEANQLACIVGEHEDDIRTFDEAGRYIRDGVEYRCVSTVVKDVFTTYPSEGLPNPPHAAAADREAAERAFANLNKEGHIVYALTPSAGSTAKGELDRLGFVAIVEEEDG